MKLAIYLGIFILFALGSLYFFHEIKDVIRAWYFGISLPSHTVHITKNMALQMPDGIKLLSDLYRPTGDERYPVVLIRTPYGKDNPEHRYEDIGRLFAGQGIVCVIQDVRGKWTSEGTFYPHRNETADGAQLVSWATEQPWSNGSVIPFGFSYMALTAWQASEESTAVKSIIPWFGSSKPFPVWYEQEGVPFLKFMLFWMCQHAGPKIRNISHEKADRALASGTDWKSLDEQIIGSPIGAYRDFLTHATNDAYWHSLSPLTSDHLPNVPVLLGTGWFDQFISHTISDFQTLHGAPEGSPQRKSCLVIGPWTHNPLTPIKELNLGSEAHFLLGIQTICAMDPKMDL